MDSKEMVAVSSFIDGLLSQRLIFDDIQEEGKGSCSNLKTLMDKERASMNFVAQIEARLMLLKCWIEGDEVSNVEHNDEANTIATQKKQCEELREQITNMCQKLKDEYTKLQTKLKLLGNQICEFTQKSLQYKDLKTEKMSKVADILGPHFPADDSGVGEDLLSKIEHAKEVCLTGTANISKLETKLDNLKLSCKELTRSLQQKEMQYRQLKREQDDRLTQMKEDSEISQQMLDRYQSLSGVTLRKYEKDLVQVEMKGDDGTSDKSLLVTFFFRSSSNGITIVSNVEVSDSNLYIVDCVKMSRDLQDVPACLINIRERWLYYMHMVDHIKDIQERLPVDWIQHQNKLRVVVGKNANIICILKLPSSDQPRITLLDVRGGVSEMTENLRPSNPDASVKEWVQHLEEQFS